MNSHSVFALGRLRICLTLLLGSLLFSPTAVGQTQATQSTGNEIDRVTLSPTPPPGIPLSRKAAKKNKPEEPCPDSIAHAKANSGTAQTASPQQPSTPAAAANREAAIRELPLTSPRPTAIPSATKRDEKCGNESEVSYVPTLTGAIKARFETSTYDGKHRFNIRNAQLGAMGNVSRNMFYRLFVDFNNEGKVSVLDSYVGYRIGGFDIRIGQQHYYFSTDLARGPSNNMFSNRSFLAKYLTCYTGGLLADGTIDPTLSTIGPRDIGVVGTYTFTKRLPLKLFLAILNGSGCNNPTWNNTINVMGRFELGKAQGFRLAGAYLDGSTPLHAGVLSVDGALKQTQISQKLRMMDVELRYVHNNIFLESEYARRYLEVTPGTTQVMAAALIQGYYRFMMPQHSGLTYIAPTTRWDMGNGINYLNLASDQLERLDANRITLGVNFGFGKQLVRSEIRINYEKYILQNRPSDFATNKLFQDKFTIEVVAAF